MAEVPINHIEKVWKLMEKADTTQDEMQELYTTWYQTYDKDLIASEYTGPIRGVEHLTRKLKEYGRAADVCILDVGCGTGLVGEELHKRGYKNINGVDLSAKMLNVAKAKDIYRSLHKGAVGSLECKDLGVAANQYDAAISVGVFTSKHVSSEGFNDLVHVVKPGGLVYFSIKEGSFNDPENTYGEKMEQFEQEGKWKLVMKDYNPVHISHGALYIKYCKEEF